MIKVEVFLASSIGIANNKIINDIYNAPPPIPARELIIPNNIPKISKRIMTPRSIKKEIHYAIITFLKSEN